MASVRHSKTNSNWPQVPRPVFSWIGGVPASQQPGVDGEGERVNPFVVLFEPPHCSLAVDVL